MSISEHERGQQRYFDAEFEGYSRYQLENWRRSFLNRIFTALGIGSTRNESYLDIGVGGSGYTVIEATRKGCVSVGVDISSEGVRKAKTFANSELGRNANFDFVVGSIDNLPFKDETFAKISTIAVLEHVPDDKRAILEMSRVSKPDGEVFITVPNAYSRIFPIFWLPYFFWDKRVGHLRHYKAEDLIRQFSNCRFTPKDMRYSGHAYKLIQILLSFVRPNMTRGNSKLWWKMEELDLRNSSRAGGLQLNIVLKKGKVLKFPLEMNLDPGPRTDLKKTHAGLIQSTSFARHPPDRW
ncbi:MAG TPA: class I SAM-dependent methyltransferase [Candidatus Bathyarchaeia archaeon]|nr:class I SAM-dependent methyltransferase [Candidatus Bathyarchaeia archaeon]